MYSEGVVPLRLLRLRHSHVKQNITYTCDDGVDGFMQMQLQGINGGVIHYGDKTVRLVSQVSTPGSVPSSLFMPACLTTLTMLYTQPGECPVVLEVMQEEIDNSRESSTAAILPVKGISVDSVHSAESFSAGPVCFS